MSHPNLTPKQEKFCVLYFEGGNATKAYRDAGYAPGASDPTVNKLASEQLKNPKIQSRLTELREGVAGASVCTLQSHLSTLSNIRELAMKAGKYSAAATAEMARGQVVGLYIKRVAVSGGLDLAEKPDLSKLSETDLVALLEMLRKAGLPEQALH